MMAPVSAHCTALVNYTVQVSSINNKFVIKRHEQDI